MNEKIESMWGWIKEHKKEIVITGVISIASAFGGIILYKKFDRINTIDWHMPVLDISPGHEAFHGGGTQIAIYDDSFSLAAMGKLGEYIAANIPNLPDNPEIVYAEFVMAD